MEEKTGGWITEQPRASVSFLFIYSPCLFCFFLFAPSHFFPHIFSTLSLCPLSILLLLFIFPPLSFFPSFLRLPREKRFCLLLVSAPSQSAFLISSYCFCLIFKCYPGPNGNPYKKRSERRKAKPAGYCVSLQDPKTKAPPPPPPLLPHPHP